MSDPKTPYSLSAISPENFALILQRLTQPSAEEKMRAAFARLEADLESAKEIREKIRLEKKRAKLERRLTKLVEFKKRAAGPLIGSLLLSLFVWLVIIGTAGTATYASVNAALQRDIENVEENLKSLYTVQEMREGFNVGQYMGMPEGFHPGDSGETPEEWPEPAWYVEITDTKFADDCSLWNETVVEKEDCVGSARLELILQDQPDVSMTCVFGVPNEKNFLEGDRTFVNQENAFVNSGVYFIGKGELTEELRTMLACQVYNLEDSEKAMLMAYTVGQAALRDNAGFHLAGGFFTWFESDGSYAPRSTWDGYRPDSD